MSETPRQRVGPIGKILFEAGLVTREQVAEALEIQRAEGGKTFEILIRLGHLNKESLHAVLSQQPGIASIDLERFKVAPELVSLIPKDMALKELVLPIDQLGKLLTVAMACPLDVETIARIEQISGLRVKALLCKYDDILVAVEKCYSKQSSGPQEMPTFEMPSKHLAQAPSRNLTEDVKRLDALAVAPGVLDKLLEHTREGQADLKAAMQTASSDPALAGWLLAVANTPAYGVTGQVDSLGLAMALLGADGIAASIAYLKREAPQPKADFAAAYEAARKASLVAAVLSKKVAKVERGAAYTAALLRRIGWFSLATIAPNDLSSIPATDESVRCEEERKRFGLTHLEAGGITASRWRFPDSLLAAVSTPESEAGSAVTPGVALACVATVLAERGLAEGAACLKGLGSQLAVLGMDAATAYGEVSKILEG